MSRKIILKDKKLVDYLGNVKKISEEINTIIDEWKKKDEFVGKLNLKMERYKEKIRSIVADNVKEGMGEFEVVGSTKEEKGEAVIEIFDKIEMYKEQLREQANAKTNTTTESSDDKISGGTKSS